MCSEEDAGAEFFDEFDEFDGLTNVLSIIL
jgi:hypothetical protein